MPPLKDPLMTNKFMAGKFPFYTHTDTVNLHDTCFVLV